MLYERWLKIARAFPQGLALRDLTSNRQWTFQELERAAETPGSESGKIAFPTGVTAEFVLTVLRAWRTGQLVCPMESDQHRPEIKLGLPPEIVHLKMTSGTTATPRFV